MKEGTLTTTDLCTYVTGTGLVCNQANNSTNWDSAYTYRVTGVGGTSPLTLTLSNNVISGSIAGRYHQHQRDRFLQFHQLHRFQRKPSTPSRIIATSASPQFTALTLTNALTAANGGPGIKGGTAPNGTLLIGNGSGYALNTLTSGQRSQYCQWGRKHHY